MLNSINDINTKVTKLFHNPNINFFIIMMLILIISCYTLINTPLKYAISSFISNPIIILFSLILVILLGYYNINISILVLLLLFIALYGTTIFNGNTRNNTNISNITSKPTKSSMKGKIEGFKNVDTDDDTDDDDDSDDDSDDEDDINVPKITKSPHKTYEEKDAETDETVKKIKDTLLGPMADIKNSGENEFKQKLLENKQIQYLSEKKNNRNTRNNNTSKQNFTNTGSKSKKENFQTIKLRKFDPSKEEDTNFLITKEILQDMVVRIDYNYESSPYLKKYIKHRVEEIVEINKLLEDDD